MKWIFGNKTKPCKEKYLLTKNVSYKGCEIKLWVTEGRMKGNNLGFNVGYSVDNEDGYYNSGISEKNVRGVLDQQLLKAKEQIDEKIKRPSSIDNIKNLNLDSLE